MTCQPCAGKRRNSGSTFDAEAQPCEAFLRLGDAWRCYEGAEPYDQQDESSGAYSLSHE
jgi:hypothetical protein